MKAAILTLEQKNSLDGQLICADMYFHSVLDCNSNWIITEPQITQSIYPQNDWVKTLPLIDWCAPPQPPPVLNNYVGS